MKKPFKMRSGNSPLFKMMGALKVSPDEVLIEASKKLEDSQKDSDVSDAHAAIGSSWDQVSGTFSGAGREAQIDQLIDKSGGGGGDLKEFKRKAAESIEGEDYGNVKRQKEAKEVSKIIKKEIKPNKDKEIKIDTSKSDDYQLGWGGGNKQTDKFNVNK